MAKSVQLYNTLLVLCFYSCLVSFILFCLNQPIPLCRDITNSRIRKTEFLLGLLFSNYNTRSKRLLDGKRQI